MASYYKENLKGIENRLSHYAYLRIPGIPLLNLLYFLCPGMRIRIIKETITGLHYFFLWLIKIKRNVLDQPKRNIVPKASTWIRTREASFPGQS